MSIICSNSFLHYQYNYTCTCTLSCIHVHVRHTIHVTKTIKLFVHVSKFVIGLLETPN